MQLIDCPVCKGSGIYCDLDHLKRLQENPCMACHGSGTLPMTDSQYARWEREHDYVKATPKPRKPGGKKHFALGDWTAEELAVVAKMMSVSETMEGLKDIGSKRSYQAMMRIRFNMRHVDD